MMRKMDARENFFQAVTPIAISLAFIGLLLLAEPDMQATGFRRDARWRTS